MSHPRSKVLSLSHVACIAFFHSLTVMSVSSGASSCQISIDMDTHDDEFAEYRSSPIAIYAYSDKLHLNDSVPMDAQQTCIRSLNTNHFQETQTPGNVYPKTWNSTYRKRASVGLFNDFSTFCWYNWLIGLFNIMISVRCA
jgi:hypothetical protein